MAISKYENERIFVVATADRTAANDALAADLGPDNLSTPIYNNAAAIVAYGCHGYYTDAQLGILQRVIVDDIGGDEYDDPWATVIALYLDDVLPP